jgi:hypothetical protein
MANYSKAVDKALEALRRTKVLNSRADTTLLALALLDKADYSAETQREVAKLLKTPSLTACLASSCNDSEPECPKCGSANTKEDDCVCECLDCGTFFA